ncbi:unnamed protein product [Diamesa tonsa]
MENIISAPDNEEFNEYGSIGELMIRQLRKNASKTLLISGITSEETTANDLLDKSMLLAKCLYDYGIREGDVISIVSENRVEMAEIIYAVFYLNAIVAPINLTYTEREMTHAFNLSKPKLIFTSAFAGQKVLNVVKSLSYVKNVILIEDTNAFGASVVLYKHLLSNPKCVNNLNVFIPAPVDKKSTVCLILCSSGTTGLPKGVQLSQANLIVGTRFTKQTVLDISDIAEDERVILGIIPWFHAFGFLTLVAVTVATSAKIVFLPKFEEGLFLSCVENYKTSILFMVPPLMVFLAKHPMVDGYDTSSIQTIICGAAPLSKELEMAVQSRLKNKKCQIRQGYGMSELTLSVLLQKKTCKPGSVGDINAGSTVKVIDEQGNSLGANKPGELCFKGNQLMVGYIGNDEATQDIIDDDGWLHTGDIGYYDEDKQFFIIDRIKELIKYKGFQVPPAEIEAILLQHPNIQDAAVIGIPDELAGELPLAFVVKVPGKEITKEEVIQYVAKVASSAKRLHGGVWFINEIPKNPSGKILRRELRDLVKNTKDLKSKL